jgi:hypothetical protein
MEDIKTEEDNRLIERKRLASGWDAQNKLSQK